MKSKVEKAMKTKVVYSPTHYERVHGRRPHGNGQWVFEVAPNVWYMIKQAPNTKRYLEFREGESVRNGEEWLIVVKLPQSFRDAKRTVTQCIKAYAPSIGVTFVDVKP